MHSGAFPFPFVPAKAILIFELSSLCIWANILLKYLVQCESQPVFSENFGSLQVIRLYDQGAKHTAVCLICTHFVSETNTSVSVFIHTFPVKVRVAFQQHIGMCTGSLFYLVQQYVLCTLTSPISDTDFRLFGIIRQYFLKKRKSKTKHQTFLLGW